MVDGIYRAVGGIDPLVDISIYWNWQFVCQKKDILQSLPTDVLEYGCRVD
jgi:hypothetical protein